MLLWLPLFSGNALAASIPLRAQGNGCDQVARIQTLSHAAMDHAQHDGGMPADAGCHDPACSDHDLCHLACTGYLAAPDGVPAVVATQVHEAMPYRAAFHSRHVLPLDHPPLACA